MIACTVIAKVDGVEHRIPANWLVGFCRAQAGLPARSHEDAVRWWHEQWELQRQHEHESEHESEQQERPPANDPTPK